MTTPEEKQAAAKEKASALKEQILSTRGSVAEEKEADKLAKEQLKEQEKAEKEEAKAQEKANKEAAKSVQELVKEDGLDALPDNFDYFIVGEIVRARINEDGESFTVVTADGKADTVDGETFAADYVVVPPGDRVKFLPPEPPEPEAKNKDK